MAVSAVSFHIALHCTASLAPCTLSGHNSSAERSVHLPGLHLGRLRIAGSHEKGNPMRARSVGTDGKGPEGMGEYCVRPFTKATSKD